MGGGVSKDDVEKELKAVRDEDRKEREALHQKLESENKSRQEQERKREDERRREERKREDERRQAEDRRSEQERKTRSDEVAMMQTIIRDTNRDQMRHDRRLMTYVCSIGLVIIVAIVSFFLIWYANKEDAGN